MPTILNVDDKELNRYIRSEILRKAKYRVVEADGGRRAVELCHSLKPELVLLDVNMPDLGGREVCRLIKEGCGANRPVIVVHISATATATEDQVRGLEGGADAYLIDPVDAALLLATVRSMLRLQSAERKLAERDASLRRLVDSNVVGIAIAGMEGIKEANDEYLRVVGMTRDDLASGRVHWRKVTPPEHLERFLNGIEELRRRGAWTPFEMDGIRADGTRVPVLIGASALSMEPLEWICFVADLSVQKRSEAELRARTQELRSNETRLRGQKEAFQAAINGAPLQESLGILARIVAEETAGAARTAFYIADRDFTCLHPIRGAGDMPDSYTNLVNGFPIGHESLACGLAIASGRAVLTRDVFEEALWKPWLHLAEEYHFRGCWSFPIKTRDRKPIGTFAMYFREPQDAAPQGVALAKVVTQTAAIIISRHTEAQERARAEEMLRQSEERLRSVNADLEQFAYSASHDLLEPLRTIKIFSELLAKRFGQSLDDNAHEFIDHVCSGATRMERLVRDLLIYTKTTTQDDEPAGTSDATQCLQEAMANLSGAIAESEAKITFDPLPCLPVNSVHLRQLFQNLVGNAIKYGRQGITPIIHVTAKQQDGRRLFSVTDNGIGIESEYRERVFGLFKRLHSGDESSGSGVGLALCQRIVERYDGRIWVESEPGKGSTFFFTLPG